MVYIDHARIPYKGMLMSHMVADTLDELHAMAAQLHLKESWFQNHGIPHYDVCESLRTRAIKFGAKAITVSELKDYIRKFRKEQHLAEESLEQL